MGLFLKALSAGSTICPLLPSVVSVSPAARLKTALQQSLYGASCSHAPRSLASQSKREARHLHSILPGNMPAKKTNRRRRRRSWGGMNGRLALWKCTGTCPDEQRSYISSKSSMRTNKSFFFSPFMHVAADDWQQKSAACPLISLLRCGEHDVTCFVRALHQNFWFCYKAANSQDTEYTNVQRQIYTALLVEFNHEEKTFESWITP